jgi:phage terminase small subunit
MSDELTDKLKLFVREYIVDFNGAQAAIRAGYSEKSAASIASENLTKPNVAAAIESAMQERIARTQVNADYVLQRLVEIDQMDAIDIMNDDGSLKPLWQWPKIWRQYLSGFDINEEFDGYGDEKQLIGHIKKIKWPNKVKNLELIGKHVNVQAWRERQVQPSEMLDNISITIIRASKNES